MLNRRAFLAGSAAVSLVGVKPVTQLDVDYFDAHWGDRGKAFCDGREIPFAIRGCTGPDGYVEHMVADENGWPKIEGDNLVTRTVRGLVTVDLDT